MLWQARRGLIAGRGALVSAAGGGGSAESAAFLARTSGLDSTHIAAYTTLIDALVAHGIWSKLDILYIFATQNSTTALLNLVSSSFNGTAHDLGTALQFTIDRGFQGANGGTSGYIDTGFNPSTASSPKFTRNDAHISAWDISGGFTTAYWSMGGENGTTASELHFRDFAGNLYGRINDNTNFSIATASWTGQLLVNRTGSSARAIYKNATSVGSDSTASVGVLNQNLYVVGSNASGSPSSSGHKHAMASVGSGLTPTNITDFKNDVNTFLVTVGAA